MNRDKINLLNMVFTSSSSSSDSDDENIEIFLAKNNKRRRKSRIKNFIETVIYAYNNKEFKQHFRMCRTTFYFLLNMLRPYLQNEDINSPVLSPERQLYIALYVLGTPDLYRSVVTKFDVGNATAWRVVKRIVKALCYFRNYFIHWPTLEEAEITSKFIQRKYNFPGIIGAVDGTHITIAAPKEDAVAYINRKEHHSIQLQVVSNHRREFIHCYAGMPGSVHDMRVFKYSGLQEKCDNFDNNKHLLGDSAYTLQKFVMVPYKDNGHLTAEEINYNYVLSRSRISVEQSIGLLKGRWRYILDKLPMRRTDLIPYYIIACCVLHNICLMQRDEFEYPVILPDEMEDPGPSTISLEQQRERVIKREKIKNHLANLT